MALRLSLLACALPLLAACNMPMAGTASERKTATQEAPAMASGAQSAQTGAQAPEAPPAEAAAAQQATTPPPMSGPLPARRIPDPPWTMATMATLNEPWAMTFLPDGRLLVTEKPGQLRLVNVANGQVGTISGVPAVAYGGQGGLGDVVLHPQFASNRYVYLSYAESGSGSNVGAAVARARLTLDASGNGGSLTDLQVLWRQTPKVGGNAHFSHRIAFGAGKLWITSGDRQVMTPAQDLNSNLGKLIRLNDDGSVPGDNPFAAQGGLAAQVWSLGHRNLLGIAFDAQGRLWAHEMGPRHGDELNLIERGANYGWPIVSEGDHYDGTPIPNHSTRPEFKAPAVAWVPTIAPAGFVIYSGDMYPYFKRDGFIGGLASQALIQVRFEGTSAREFKRYPMSRRIREVEQGPDGALWLLEDGGNARLLKLTARPF
jgi:aldose sugar dehydrogenase